MAHKDNSELSMDGLDERKRRLEVVHTHLRNGDKAPYSEHHAVIKAIERELEEVKIEIEKRT